MSLAPAKVESAQQHQRNVMYANTSQKSTFTTTQDLVIWCASLKEPDGWRKNSRFNCLDTSGPYTSDNLGNNCFMQWQQRKILSPPDSWFLILCASHLLSKLPDDSPQLRWTFPILILCADVPIARGSLKLPECNYGSLSIRAYSNCARALPSGDSNVPFSYDLDQ